MQYQVIVLDLDGTLTNSKKEITEPTRQALIDIQKNGKTVVLASGRPINGVAPLAKQLRLQDFGGYMLSFNGARVTSHSGWWQSLHLNLQTWKWSGNPPVRLFPCRIEYG